MLSRTRSELKKVGWSSILVAALVLALGAMAQAQQPTKVPRIGYLGAASPSANSERIEAFRQGLRELGYVEGKNIVVEYRYTEGKAHRERELAAELARLKVDVIVTTGPTVTRAAKEATVTIPIVMTNDNDPVGNGFVASLARPGGNVTGLSNLARELSGKRLELLKEIVPRLSRVAVLGTSTSPGNAQNLKELELAAGELAVKLQYLDILAPKDIETAFGAVRKGRTEAIHVLDSPVFGPQRTQIVGLAVKSRLPAIYHRSGFVEARGAYELRSELRYGSPCRHVRGQDSQRCKACGPPCRATDEIRVHHQSESR